MSAIEQALTFECDGHNLVGIVHRPVQDSDRGVVVVVGGPQYRVGSHRQFVLLGRALAEAGIPTMRFDFRGMGDSEGNSVGFEQIDPDISLAIDAFSSAVPQLREVVLWGLCDAASAILFYAHQDPRVSGTVILNPWVRTEKGMARAYLKHYYTSRILSGSFWKKVALGSLNVKESWRSFWHFLTVTRDIVRKEGNTKTVGGDKQQGEDSMQLSKESVPLPDRMLDGMLKFDGPTILIVLSGDDLTADEFRDTVASSQKWKRALSSSQVTIRELKEASHTFSSRKWRDQVALWTIDWVKSF